MTGRPQDDDRAPSEVGRPVAAVDRPASERSRNGKGIQPPRANLTRGAALGVPAVLAISAVWGLLLAVFDVDLGLVAVAVIGGWLVGQAVRMGTWSSADHPRMPAVAPLAAGLAALCWLGGSAVAYLTSLAILHSSTQTFSERLVAQPFLGWLAPQLSILDIIELTLLAVVAWRSAR